MSDDSKYRICFVCSGNICRSPMAEVVMTRLVVEAGLVGVVVVDSAGTGDWHIGERADRRAIQILTARGYDGATHRAKQFDPQWFRERDLVVALDRGHQRTLRSWAPDEPARERIHLLRAFAPAVDPHGGPELDIADPYYDGLQAFETVLDEIEAACTGLLAQVTADLFAGAAARATTLLPTDRVDLTRGGASAVAGAAADVLGTGAGTDAGAGRPALG